MISQGASSGTPSDADLLRRLRAGDQRAWEVLSGTVHAQLRQIAAAELPAELAGRADPSDIVQQTLVDAHDSLATFEGDSLSDLLVWLTAVAKNNARDAVRKHLLAERRSVRQESRLNDSSSGGGWNAVCAADQTSPSMAAVRAEEIRRLNEAIWQLPSRQRDAVRMRHLEGHTLGEIAAALDCTHDAAAQLIARGLKAIRESMCGIG